MMEDSHRVLILSDQTQERYRYRQYLANSLDPSFQIEEMNSTEINEESFAELADCVLLIQSQHRQELALLHRLSLSQANAPGVVYVVKNELADSTDLAVSPQIELITADEASPYRIVHAIHRSIERREILRQLDEYDKRLLDAQEILDQLWDDVVGPALILDIEGVVRHVNIPFLQLTQESPDNFIGHGYTDFLPAMDETIFRERLNTILGQGSGVFWSGQFATDRQPQYPLRFSARVTGKKEPFSRFMVLVEPHMTEMPAPALPATTLMQHLEAVMRSYEPHMTSQECYSLLMSAAQESLEAQGVAIFSFNAAQQSLLKEKAQGSLPAWLEQNTQYSQDDYLFRNALSEQRLKAFKLSPAPEQRINMLVTLPLMHQKSPFAALCLAFDTARDLSDEERSFLDLLGAWAAQILSAPTQLTEKPVKDSKPGFTPEDIRNRSDILPVIAHELRTPLTVLMGYAQLLQRRLRVGSIFEERNLNALHTILDRAQRVDETLETLIELARIDMGTFSIYTMPVNVSALLRDVLLNQRKQTAHTLIFDGVEEAMVLGDEVRLRRVFSSLIHNASIYSPVSGIISVIVECEDKLVRILVNDEGEGIRDEQIDDIFTRFSNVRSEQVMTGMGVSLYMAKIIVEAHQGRIVINSTLGRGSRVIIELPRIAS